MLTRDNLFKFQQEDVDKLLPQRSALIANEMGTGKTWEAIALDAFKRNGDTSQRTLVVCNKSQIENTWGKLYGELTSLPVVTYSNKDRADFIKRLYAPGGGVFIINWEALRLLPELRDVHWFCIIADECQKMKNRKAQQSIALRRIKG